MQIGDIYRYVEKAKADPAKPRIDGIPNYYHVTHSPGQKLALLERGIASMAKALHKGIQLRPAILIRSSPHKIGSSQTPWQDFFDSDVGHIRYFGDNKTPGRDPSNTQGNKALLEQFDLHNNPDAEVRERSAPLLFFRATPFRGQQKGFVQFHGYGIIDSVERITQLDPSSGSAFTNYSFDFAVLSLADESETFSWDWITARRNKALSLEETHRLAPSSWRRWIKGGRTSLPAVRRHVSKLTISKKVDQVPQPGSKEESALKQIYHYYTSESKKHNFEALAQLVASRVLGGGGGRYRSGWITTRGGDGGTDFVGRLDVGTGFARTKLIVLGQAKCEKPNNPTGGTHIARTVARLKRGWVGVYVTTSFFSEAVQREVIEDSYPLVMIHGKRLAEEVLTASHESRSKDVVTFLSNLDESYEDRIQQRRPEEILIE